jgi:hypothetical protein
MHAAPAKTLRKPVKPAEPAKTSKPLLMVPMDKLTGKYGVMRQSTSLKRMKFQALHDDVLSATEEAKRMKDEHPDLLFMVVKVITSIGP